MEPQMAQVWMHVARLMGYEEVYKAAYEAGVREGRRQAKVEILLRILRIRHVHVPVDFEKAVEAVKDLGRLDAVIDAALDNASFEAFHRASGL